MSLNDETENNITKSAVTFEAYTRNINQKRGKENKY